MSETMEQIERRAEATVESLGLAINSRQEKKIEADIASALRSAALRREKSTGGERGTSEHS